MGNLSKLFGPMLDEWAKEAQEERSRTWKERHAKGVPVRMDLGEYLGCRPGKQDASHWYGINKYSRGEPYIECMDESCVRSIATFCNFRYKKGGENGHT
jgi:hypothetical protein